MMPPSVLYEPSQWQREAEKVLPSVVPAPDRSHLATPVGLLFNELQHSPQGVITPVFSLLDLVLDMDAGRFVTSTAPTILYVVRLAVRVEGYMLYLLQHNQWAQESDPVNEGEARGFIRGLKLPPDTMQVGMSSSCQFSSEVQR